MAWSIRNYNTFIRQIRHEFDFDVRQAREAYRELRDELGRSLFGTDVKRHHSKIQDFRLEHEREEAEETEGKGEISDLESFYDWWEEGIDYEIEEFESSADYAED
jgi:hypothetical protein